MENNNIKVVSIHFGSPAFRKLENLTVEFAERITLIAGHNGIGKSTILALTTNNFGITGNNQQRSYFNKTFSSNVEVMMHVDVSEVDDAQLRRAPPVQVVCRVNNVEVTKDCSLTRRSEYQRARIVPRTHNSREVIECDGISIGPDAKVPLPTIYLGIKRMLPAGEAKESDVSSASDTVMHQDDIRIMANFVNSVVVGGNAREEGITSQQIRGAGKYSKQPGYEHDTRSISLGQDSLGSIATALASFNMLKREMGESYPGGLLVIDELDAGFHPHAIKRLARELKSIARRLNLQVIATTHSPRLIEAIHAEGEGNERGPDKVIYLHDTVHPCLAPNQSLNAILADMNLEPVQEEVTRKKNLYVYFEDEEAEQFFNILLSRRVRNKISRQYNVKLVFIPLGVGGSNLIHFPKKDAHFRETVLVVDADTSLPRNKKDRENLLKLPGGKDEVGQGLSPERTIKQFLTQLLETGDERIRQLVAKLHVQNPSSDLIRSTFIEGRATTNERESMKKWWIQCWSLIQSWKVIEVWKDANQGLVSEMEHEFEQAIKSVIERSKSVGRT